MYRIGDKVILVDKELLDSRFPDNPNSCEEIGVVTGFNSSPFYINVNWGSYSNIYHPKFIRLAGVPKNKLSEIVYPDCVETDCGKYLIPNREEK